jgi:hypothetical protein
MKRKRVAGAAALVFALGAMTPVAISAQSLSEQSRRRQQTKNQWRNLAFGAGAVALYGLLKKDSTITFAGAAGALYSLHRYEQDRKSQSKIDQARAAMFSRQSFTRNGQRYVRRTVRKNGRTYYQFVRAR